MTGPERRQLNMQLKEATTLQALAGLVKQHSRRFDAVLLTTALNRCVRLAGRSVPPPPTATALLRALVAEARAQLVELDGQALAQCGEQEQGGCMDGWVW